MSKNKVGQRIKEAAEVLGGVSALATTTGIPRRTLNGWIMGESDPRLSGIVEISRHTGKSVNWLSGSADFSLEGTAAGIQKSAPREDRIPNLLIHSGMGNGGQEIAQVDQNGQPLPEFTDGGWQLPEGASSRLGRTKGIYSHEVEGDSMFPTIAGGSTVVVDTNKNVPTSPGIFDVDYGDGLMTKRVELIGGTDKIAVMSDNERYRDYEFSRDDVRIYGRIIAKWEWID